MKGTEVCETRVGNMGRVPKGTQLRSVPEGYKTPRIRILSKLPRSTVQPVKIAQLTINSIHN